MKMSIREYIGASLLESNANLVYNAREILLEAAQEQRSSMKWFEEWQKNNEDEIYWDMSREHDEIAKGILKAYEIITNHRVTNFLSNIEREIEWIEHTYNLSH